MSAETERVRKRNVGFKFACFIRRIIKIAFGIRFTEINSRRNYAGLQRYNGSYGFNCSGAAGR